MTESVQVAVFSRPARHNLLVVDQHRAVVALTARRDLNLDVELHVAVASVDRVKVLRQGRWVRVQAVGGRCLAQPREVVVARLPRLTDPSPQVLIARHSPPS